MGKGKENKQEKEERSIEDKTREREKKIRRRLKEGERRMRRERGDKEEEAKKTRQRNIIWRGVEGEDSEEKNLFIKGIMKRIVGEEVRR